MSILIKAMYSKSKNHIHPFLLFGTIIHMHVASWTVNINRQVYTYQPYKLSPEFIIIKMLWHYIINRSSKLIHCGMKSWEPEWSNRKWGVWNCQKKAYKWTKNHTLYSTKPLKFSGSFLSSWNMFAIPRRLSQYFVGWTTLVLSPSHYTHSKHSKLNFKYL